MSDAVVEAIHQLIAVTRGAAADKWLDATGVAECLGYALKYVQDRIVVRPDFPAAMRLDGKGHPRWLRSEVMAWARRHQG